MTKPPPDQDSALRVYKLGVKLYLDPLDEIDYSDFIAVFNEWIQDQPIPNHLLIDVHDYRHVHHGPGVLLVGHQGNFGVDFQAGRPGLVYYRKQPLEGTVDSSLRTCLGTLLQAGRLLLESSHFEKNLQFATNEILVFSNDRLLAPNQKEARVLFEEAASGILQELADGSGSFSYSEGDPRDRFAVTLELPGPGLDTLIQRLAAQG